MTLAEQFSAVADCGQHADDRKLLGNSVQAFPGQHVAEREVDRKAGKVCGHVPERLGVAVLAHAKQNREAGHTTGVAGM